MGELFLMTTLTYIGANQEQSLWNMFDKYDRVYAFEPDPEIFYQLDKRFRQFELDSYWEIKL